MLEANKSASCFLEQQTIPLIYRIHSPPEEEKLKNLRKFSQIFGFSKSFKSRKHLIGFLSQYKNHSKASLIHKLVLRCLSQACYSPINKGHYGLNFSSYTHFTSPIRRYCDLVIHRLLKKALSKKEQFCLTKQDIKYKSQFISQKEQNAVYAERKLKDIKKARFLKKYVGQSFSGFVSSITSFGLFISLKQFDIEGLARFNTLEGFWEVDEFHLSARNTRTAYTIKFGDTVEILIVSSHPTTGQIDFQLLGHKGHPIINKKKEKHKASHSNPKKNIKKNKTTVEKKEKLLHLFIKKSRNYTYIHNS